MTDTTAPKTRTPRTKPDGPRAHVVSTAGKEWLLTLDSVRVATAADLNRALDGQLPRAQLTPAVVKAAQS
jgi:hypothetical protein